VVDAIAVAQRKMNVAREATCRACLHTLVGVCDVQIWDGSLARDMRDSQGPADHL
jgi:hypothetical protein